MRNWPPLNPPPSLRKWEPDLFVRAAIVSIHARISFEIREKEQINEERKFW